MRKEYELPDPDTGKLRFDELAYNTGLRERLDAVQPVSDAAFESLATLRRETILAFLRSAGELDAGRYAPGAIVEADTNDDGRIRVPLEVDAGAITQ